jgi:GntR family transcriptional regulator of arabinose operon
MANRTRSVRIPLYQQIRQYILNQIDQKKWQPNDQIPSENELASQFHVSRITVRGAVSKLIEEGLIYRVQGKGSFIAPDAAGEPSLFNLDNDSRLIAYMMPRLDNRFDANLLSGVESEIVKHGYRLIICKTHDSKDVETKTLQEMIRLGVKGIIVYPVAGEHFNEEILKLTLNRFPLVVVDRYLKGVETNCVCSDNAEGASQAVTHLIELGHDKIGFVSSAHPTRTSMEDRWSGYEKALLKQGLPVEQRLLCTQLDMVLVNTILREGRSDEESKQTVIAYLKANPDISGLFAANTAIGLTIFEAAKELGRAVPEDLSVVFFDDYEASAYSAIPPTYVSQQEYELGMEAGKLLVSIINNPQQERRKLVMPVKLIVRGSTAANKSKK